MRKKYSLPLNIVKNIYKFGDLYIFALIAQSVGNFAVDYFVVGELFLSFLSIPLLLASLILCFMFLSSSRKVHKAAYSYNERFRQADKRQRKLDANKGFELW